MKPYFEQNGIKLFCGDSRDVLLLLESDSIDSCVTDPPAGIAFMGKSWDANKGGRDEWIAWLAGIMSEVYRVLKPGGHCFVWALPRTSHWTATALEDAGFTIREKVYHLFGSGFPKSLDVSKAIDREAGAVREQIGQAKRTGKESGTYGAFAGDNILTAPSTDSAKQWSGFGTALKPSAEEWILCRKPLSEKTVAKNVLRWGTGGLNIDGSRVEGVAPKTTNGSALGIISDDSWDNEKMKGTEWNGSPSGRWPSNLLLSHSPDCVKLGMKKVRASRKDDHQNEIHEADTKFGQIGTNKITSNYASPDGTETVENWNCVPDCPVRLLDEQSGELTSGARVAGVKTQKSHTFSGIVGIHRDADSNSGGASRFFKTFEPDFEGATRFLYTAKSSRSERNAGTEGMEEVSAAEQTGRAEGSPGLVMPGRVNSPYAGATKRSNFHPTVKPIDLMAYLIKLICPPGGTVLDCFAGSGSTLVAAKRAGFKAVGIEKEREYSEIIKARLLHVNPLFAEMAETISTEPT